MVATLGAIIITFVTTLIIAFTPLRELIPGYSSSKLKRDATELALKSDSLSKALKRNEVYIKSIQKVLNGELEYAKFNKDSILEAAAEIIIPVDLSPSKQERELREQVAKEDKNSLPSSSKNRSGNPK